MSINPYFAGGPTINEKEPDFKESLNDGNEDILNNIEPGAGLYGSFKSPESNNFGKKGIDDKNLESEKISKEKIKQKIAESPLTPIIDGFVKQGNLNFEEGELVKNTIVNNGNVVSSINGIKEITPEKKQELIVSINYLEGNEGKEKCRKMFEVDFGEKINGLKELKPGAKKGEKPELLGQNSILIEKLGGNYIKLEGGSGNNETNNKKAIDVAFKKTVNELMNGKQFHRPDNFKDTLAKINNSDKSFNERFALLKKVDGLINKDQSRGNARQSLAFQKMEKGMEGKKEQQKANFDELKKTLEKAKNDNNSLEKLKKLADDVEIALAEAEDSGDVFMASKLDVLKGEINDTISEQPA